ncbi:hypothetical protein CLAFUW4_10020 [Fulvia fulva]|nr:hypothetical protein CLAFUR4_10024 [Fulvia fulva]KAK4616938.1 hypothetical protein CLAFUR0_10022 [Fulvia fulva]WPV18919.1 hypothetical protein CLAFUW4_10020 [Fulvia fulva]WPV34620.1 hypothetical protein CLAFUW7_10021 [Fulvia fulva]
MTQKIQPWKAHWPEPVNELKVDDTLTDQTSARDPAIRNPTASGTMLYDNNMGDSVKKPLVKQRASEVTTKSASQS